MGGDVSTPRRLEEAWAQSVALWYLLLSVHRECPCLCVCVFLCACVRTRPRLSLCMPVYPSVHIFAFVSLTTSLCLPSQASSCWATGGRRGEERG